MLKTVYRSSCRDKHNCQRRDSNLDPLTPQSDAPTTRLLRPATRIAQQVAAADNRPLRRKDGDGAKIDSSQRKQNDCVLFNASCLLAMRSLRRLRLAGNGLLLVAAKMCVLEMILFRPIIPHKASKGHVCCIQEHT